MASVYIVVVYNSLSAQSSQSTNVLVVKWVVIVANGLWDRYFTRYCHDYKISDPKLKVMHLILTNKITKGRQKTLKKEAQIGDIYLI